MAGDSAHAVYECRTIDASPAERRKAIWKTILANLIALPAGNPDAVEVKIVVQVIDRRTSQVVLTWRDDPQPARRIESEIRSDLDRLDAVAFAKEWGIRTDA